MKERWVARAIGLGLTLLAACGGDSGIKPPPAIATNAALWYRGDLHYHTNYSEDALRQGGDDLATALAIADAYRDPAYLAIHPEHAGDGLDFIAVTDHRTDAALSDPNFKHPYLTVIPGEEYGGGGHANILGLRHHITHEPAMGQAQNDRHLQSIAEAHAQGAIFSANHPTQANRWNWDLETVDGLEVWNAPWSALWGESTLAQLDATKASTGFENPYIRDATAYSGGGPNAQALRLYYNLLSRGRHVALLGGSDRHMLFPAGIPTTYVRLQPAGARPTSDELVAAMRARSTFVSRSPHGAQVSLEARDAAGHVYPIGAALPMAASYTISVRVARAKGGLVRLVGGPVLPGSGPVAAQPSVLFERAVDRDVLDASFQWSVPSGGGWLHAIVLEKRILEPLDPNFQDLKTSTDKLSTGDNLIASATPLLLIADIDVALDGSKCSQARWAMEKTPCMLVDHGTGGTFYLPDAVVRLLNTWFEGGQPTDYCAGAMTSAFLAKP